MLFLLTIFISVEGIFEQKINNAVYHPWPFFSYFDFSDFHSLKNKACRKDQQVATNLWQAHRVFRQTEVVCHWLPLHSSTGLPRRSPLHILTVAGLA